MTVRAVRAIKALVSIGAAIGLFLYAGQLQYDSDSVLSLSNYNDTFGTIILIVIVLLVYAIHNIIRFAKNR